MNGDINNQGYDAYLHAFIKNLGNKRTICIELFDMFVESIENDSCKLLTLLECKLSGYLLILPYLVNDLLSCNLSCYLTKSYKHFDGH